MSKPDLNKVKVLTAQGDRELEGIKEELQTGNEGKVRTLARRAAGFYLSAYNELTGCGLFGLSFINNLRILSREESFPEEIRNSAYTLIQKITQTEITAEQAYSDAMNIINYIRKYL